MVAFNFQPRFAPLILDGKKLHTFRLTRRCEPGDKMQLFTGQRTKGCILLREVTCAYVAPWTVLGEPDEDKFAREDGFEGWDDMRTFFIDQYDKEFPLFGFLHGWKL